MNHKKLFVGIIALLFIGMTAASAYYYFASVSTNVTVKEALTLVWNGDGGAPHEMYDYTGSVNPWFSSGGTSTICTQGSGDSGSCPAITLYPNDIVAFQGFIQAEGNPNAISPVLTISGANNLLSNATVTTLFALVKTCPGNCANSTDFVSTPYAMDGGAEGQNNASAIQVFEYIIQLSPAVPPMNSQGLTLSLGR